jgi:hypothetical protein
MPGAPVARRATLPIPRCASCTGNSGRLCLELFTADLRVEMAAAVHVVAHRACDGEGETDEGDGTRNIHTLFSGPG